MSGVAKAVGEIAGIAAIIPGPHQPIAAAVAVGASAVAQITAPRPVARGSVTNVISEVEPARPYMVGESYSAGVLRHETGYGPETKDVPNPYWWEVKVFSGVGPIEGFVQELFDFQPIGSYYNGFYDSVSQLGLRPEASALTPPLNAPATNWGASHKLSGCAAIGGNYFFDRDGKVFANGRPQHGVIARGEKVYDPRLDSTYPGGSGSCRLGDEATYVYSANPALHIGTYAFGRYEKGIKIFGLGVDEAGIDWPAIVDWANDCDANGWTVNGTIREGGVGADVERQRVANLDDLAAAGGGRWFAAGSKLSFDWHRTRVPVATLTDDDFLEEGGEATALQSVRERMNGVRAQWISPAHNWQQITGEEIIGTTYRTEDGRPLTQTWPLNLVTDAGQAGELATYAMADSREIGPIPVNVKEKWRFYRPGEAITVASEWLGYNGVAVIVETDIDPETMGVPMTLKGETDAKHAYALGEVAVAPPTPVLGQTQEDRDAIATRTINPRGAYTRRSSDPAYPVAGGDGQIVIASSTATLDDGRSASFPAHTETGLAQSTSYAVFWDLVDEEYVFSTAAEPSQLRDSRFVSFGRQGTTDGASNYPPPETPPDGWSPGSGINFA